MNGKYTFIWTKSKVFYKKESQTPGVFDFQQFELVNFKYLCQVDFIIVSFFCKKETIKHLILR